jgi:NAD+ synthase
MLSIDLTINTKLTRKILVKFLQNEITKVSFRKAVLGVSGGVDSALVAYLLTEAIGAENVIGVMMPYRTSVPESLNDAKLVVKETGIKNFVVDISPMIDAYFEKFPDADNVRRGNKMARERMTILYDFSMKEKALVIGTSNKTELLLGYGTQFGDISSAINPIGDLYKTQVWQMAEEMNVPTKIIEKIPTADLWEGQSDEGELGFKYREVDKLLYLMVDKRYNTEDLIYLGFDKNFIENVRTKIKLNQFKRLPPVIAKISSRTINSDFRYLRDWGS